MSSRGSIVIVSPYRIEYGPPQTLAHVTRALAEAGYDPVCLVPTGARRGGDLERLADVRQLPHLATVPRTWNVARLGAFLGEHLGAAAAIEKIAREVDARAIYSISEAVFAGSVAARRVKIPGIVHVIGMSIRSPRLGGLAYVRMLNQMTEHFIACSSAVAEMLADYGVADDKITVVHNGVPLARIEASNELPDPLAGKPHPRIGMIAAYDARKGHDLFVGAAAIVARTVPDATFYLVGGTLDDQPESAAFERRVIDQISSLDLTNRIKRVGYVAPPELYAWIRSMDVVVVPSRTEAFAHVLVEAMKCGRAVVATGIEGNLDAFIDGYSGLYAGRDEESIAAKVIELLAEPERAAAMGRAAEKRAQLFDLESMLPALADAVRRVDEAGSVARRPRI
jgi:glycosyltransferase involved in cell wall biosynthesis